MPRGACDPPLATGAGAADEEATDAADKEEVLAVTEVIAVLEAAVLVLLQPVSARDAPTAPLTSALVPRRRMQ